MIHHDKEDSVQYKEEVDQYREEEEQRHTQLDPLEEEQGTVIWIMIYLFQFHSHLVFTVQSIDSDYSEMVNSSRNSR